MNTVGSFSAFPDDQDSMFSTKIYHAFTSWIDQQTMFIDSSNNSMEIKSMSYLWMEVQLLT